MNEGQPLSFPAILRNPGLTTRYAHLHLKHQLTPSPPAVKNIKREHNEGKRWVRRKENARFTNNPHIVPATKQDYALQFTQPVTTFPEPLPPSLQRSIRVPASVPTITDPDTANAGRFSLSLKGMRRELRRAGFRAEGLVRSIEHEIVGWLQTGGTVLAPDAEGPYTMHLVETPVGETGTIFEVSRTPLEMVWSIADDSFARYVVHCCARYHEVVSFSKETSGRRLTYLLRPNVTRPDYRAPAAMATPPITDLDHSSQPDTDTDRGIDSDVEQQRLSSSGHSLSVISEDSLSPRVHGVLHPPSSDEESWSIISDSDVEADASESDVGLAVSVGTLSLVPESGLDPDTLPTTEATPRPIRLSTSVRSRVWEHRHRQGRSASSPSRSPSRRTFRRGPNPLRFTPRAGSYTMPPHDRQSFYDYLFL